MTKEAEIVRAKNKTLVLVKKLGGVKIGRSGLEGGNGLEGMVWFLSLWVLGFLGWFQL